MSLIKNLNRLVFSRNCQLTVPLMVRKYCSIKGMTLEYGNDPSELFIDTETQKLLKSMTQLRLGKLLRQKN